MTDTGVVDLDTNFVCLGCFDLDILDAEVLAGFPGNCCLCFRQHACLVVLWLVPSFSASTSAFLSPPIFAPICVYIATRLRTRMPSPTCDAVIEVGGEKFEDDALLG
jgi:hypothetical protein